MLRSDTSLDVNTSEIQRLKQRTIGLFRKAMIWTHVVALPVDPSTLEFMSVPSCIKGEVDFHRNACAF